MRSVCRIVLPTQNCSWHGGAPSGHSGAWRPAVVVGRDARYMAGSVVGSTRAPRQMRHGVVCGSPPHPGPCGALHGGARGGPPRDFRV